MYHTLCQGAVDGKDRLTKEFVDMFDCVIVMHIPRWISGNWEAMKHKVVIWRTIGQSITNTEAELRPFREQGLKIVRYSPNEMNIPGYLGGDALIRFYKDPEEYKNWNGKNKRIVTFNQSMQQRTPHCNFPIYDEVTKSVPRILFGPGNEHLEFSPGKVSFEQLKAEMRNNRAYFYTGTHPASYTLNFIEALMTGIPVIALGPVHGNAQYLGVSGLYEIDTIIRNSINGFISDDVDQLRKYCDLLLNDIDLAREIGANGRATALQYFGQETIQTQWKTYLQTL